jgi:hypothetical protein
MARKNGEPRPPDRLQPNEDPTSLHLEDATHWKEVYQELLKFKATLTRTMEKLGEQLDEDAQSEVSRDLKALREEAEYLQRRLDFWLAREERLE